MQQEFLKLEMERLPNRGIYLLLIKNEVSRKIKVGSLGEVFFKQGYYVYVGSAQRNLKKRIKRHLRKEKRIRWHVDYFLTYAFVEDVYASELSRNFEEKLAKLLSLKYDYISGFGSSDTKAPSHLFYIGRRNEWEIVKRMAKEI